MVLVTVNLLAQSGQFLCSAHPTLILSASVCCACCHVVVDREPGRSPILSGRVLLTVLQPRRRRVAPAAGAALGCWSPTWFTRSALLLAFLGGYTGWMSAARHEGTRSIVHDLELADE